MRNHLADVTLIGVDCVDIERLIRAAAISTTELRFDEVRLLSSLTSKTPWVEPIAHLGDVEAYNEFVLKQLHAYVNTSLALVIQHDGFVLNPSRWTDDFRRWDYTGAPWSVGGERIVGNGGFSLRSRRLLERLAAPDILRPAGTPEDWFICVSVRDRLESEGYEFAPPDVAHAFSFEGDPAFGVRWHGQFGFHGLTWTDISAWISEHPDAGIVNELDEQSRRLLGQDPADP